MRRALSTLLIFGLGCLLTVGGRVAAAPAENADVRVLIDISGSMKQNDPRNLRRPALRMLVGLLQPGTRAGVWTFAKYARELVPVGPVDQAWKDAARKASDEINSPGLFTNIETVIKRAIDDWEGAPQDYRRHLLLLTDGVVDVSKVPGESSASRRQILEVLLPKLREMGVQLHAVALSAHADHELLKQLAGETGGWYEQVDTADQLQRVFLKLFEKAGKPDGLPLKGNKFLVDNTVREATILLFRAADTEEPMLTTPSGVLVSRDDQSASINWHRDTGYDLITLHDPEAGEWSLNADVDPDNRVLIVTDMQLQASEVPSRIAAGEPLLVTASMTNDGHLITRRDFLDVVDLHAETVGARGLMPQPLNDKGHKGDAVALDGTYSMELVERQAQPEVSLVIAAESPTFTRETRHVLTVIEPARLTVREQDGALQARLLADKTVMKIEGLEASLWQQDPQGNHVPLEATQASEGGFQASLPEPAWPVYASLEGMTLLGNPLSRELGPVYVEGMAPEPPAEATDDKSEPAAVAAPPEEKPVEEPGWMMPAMIFGGANLLLIIAGLVFWWLRSRGKDGDEVVLLDEAEGQPEAESETEPDSDEEAAA